MKSTYAVRDAGSAGRMSRRRVTEVMRTPVATVGATMPLHEALGFMVTHRVHHAAAVDAHGRCLGVLEDRAVLARWANDMSPLREQTVASALPGRPAIVAQNAVIAQAARLMRATGVTAVAVADRDGLPVGIISGPDLVALLASDTGLHHDPTPQI